MKNILFFLLLLSGSIYGQSKQKDNYTIYVNYPDYTVKANISNLNKKPEAKETLTYTWYASNRIIETTGGYDGKVLNGLYTSYYLSNNLKEKGNFNKGLKHGEWITWFEDGKIHEISNWKKGIKNGIFKLFDNKGHLVTESYFKNGKLNGYQTVYENEKITDKKKYKKGIEIVKKPKKEVVDKDESCQPKRSFKEKVRSVFKKKDKKNNNQAIEKTKPAPADKKPKKTFKEKFRSLFKKKDKAEKPKSETK